MEWRKLKVASPADAVLVERILWQNCATVAQIELALLVPEPEGISFTVVRPIASFEFE